MNDPNGSGIGRNIKRALTLQNIAIAIVVAVVVGFVLACFGVLPI